MKIKEEIEIRGKLHNIDVDRIFSLLEKDGNLIKHYKRLSVDISPGFDPVTKTWNNTDNLDLRIKKSDTEEKISLKVGNYNSINRKEIEVSIKSGEFLDAVSLFESLGFNKGMIYNWENWEFDYEGFEVKITKFKDDYYIWEIESKLDGGNPFEIAKKLNLKPFTKLEFKKEIDWQNNNINKLYSFEEIKKLTEV